MRTLEFQRVLGAGAFGVVYLADLIGSRDFRRQVAVKIILANNPDGDMFVTRVRDEARLLGLLQDDHILKVLELVRIEGRDAVVMEYVEGVDLGAIVEAGFRPPPRALAELAAAVAGALHRAHTATHPGTGEPMNVIHRDVKPANIMLSTRGNVKLLDFGVARARFEARESFTGQFVLGTLNYMAPEYIVTGQISPAADIYGLALTMWEAVTGEVYGQPKLRKDQHDQRLGERLRQLGDGYNDLATVLQRMLAWNPAERPDGATVERMLLASTDSLKGKGLRSWTSEVVARVIALQSSNAKDVVNLVGRSIPLGDAETAAPPKLPASKAGAASSGAGSSNAGAANAPAAPHASNAGSLSAHAVSSGAAASASLATNAADRGSPRSGPAVAAKPPPSAPPSPRPRPRSRWPLLLLQVVAASTLTALLVLAVVGALLIIKSLP